MSTYLFPTAAELKEIEQDKLPVLLEDDPLLKEVFPMEERDEALLMWEQKDNYLGLQQLRGMNGQPPHVKPVGISRYTQQPGIYGEHMLIEETEITLRRGIATFNMPISISDLVQERQDQLLQRRLDRIRQIAWTLITTGTFSVSKPMGGVMHTDTYTLQTLTGLTVWSDFANATPLANFRAAQLLSRGHSVSFGSDATAYMNRATWNEMIANTNAADLFGRRTQGLGTFNNLNDVNSLITGDDLPNIVVYDDHYLDDAGAVQLFIPNDVVVIIGKRPGGQALGAYRMVRNANNPNAAPGPYTRVIDKGETQVPRLIEVHDGHNGGPVIYWPSAVVVMSV